MKRLNKKAFTLVEILVAIAILAVAVVGIGSVIISTQNNTTKRLTEADLQQQVTEIKETIHNGLLSANLGVNCWIKEGDTYKLNGDGKLSTEQDKESKEKILALYNIDREDFIVETTYYKWNKDDKTLSTTKTTKEVRENGRFPSSDYLVQIDEDIQNIVEDSTWSLIANHIDYFNVRLENPDASQKLISVDLNVSQNKSVYPVNDTVYVRNEIKTNSNEFLIDKYTTITLRIPRIPENSTSVFTYDGQTHTPKIVDYYENYMTITEGSTKSASASGEYYIRFELKDKTNYQWPDGTTTPKTIFWSIGKRTIYVDFGVNTWVYDKQEHTVDYKIRGYDRLEEIGLTITNQTIGPDVCEKTCTITVENPNFEFGNDNSIKLSITPAIATASIDLHTRTWNGNPQVIASVRNANGGTVKFFTNTNGVTPDKNSVTFNDCIETNANTYYVFYVVSQDNSGNYISSDVLCAGQVEIKRAETAHAQVSDFTYDTLPHTTNTSVHNNGVIWSGDITKTNAGKYTAYATPDSNHTWPGGGTERKALEWTIKKASGHIVPPVGANLVYTGYSQCLLQTEGSTKWGSVQYKVGMNGNWSSNIPYMTNAGEYKVYYYSTGDINHEPTDNTAFITVIMKKANGDNRFKPHPSAKTGLMYNGSPQALVKAGAVIDTDAVIKYSVAPINGDGTVGTYKDDTITVPAETNAGKYRVRYFIDQADDSNYEDSKYFYIDVFIARAPTAEFAFDRDKVYNEESQRGYTYQNVVLGGSPTGINVNTYTTTAVPGSNYIWKGTTEGTAAATEQKSITWKILKRDNYISKNPTFVGDMIQYNDSIQELVTDVGASAYGTKKVEFRVKKNDGSYGNWQTEAITSNAFGTYTIEYRAQGDNNHNAGPSSTKSIFVKPNAARLLTPPSATSPTFNGTSQALLTAGTCENGIFEYAVSTTSSSSGFGNRSTNIPSGTNAGTYYVRYYIKGSEAGIGNWDENKDGVDDYGTLTVVIARKKDATFTYTSATPANRHYVYDGTQKTAITGSNITYTYQGPGSSWDCTYATYTHYYYSVNGHPENANGFTVKAVPSSNYCWADTGGTEERSLTWYIDRAATGWWWGTVDWVNGCNTLTYNGSSQSLIKYGGGVYITGSEYATNAGTYYITGSVDANHLWNDGTSADKYWTWYIANKQDASAWASNKTENGSWQTACGASNAWKSSGNDGATTHGDYSATYTAYANHAFYGGGTTHTVYWTMYRYVTVYEGDWITFISGARWCNSSGTDIGGVPDWVRADVWYLSSINSVNACLIRQNKSGTNDVQSRTYRSHIRYHS